MSNPEAFIEEFREYLSTHVAPQAEQVDRDHDSLKSALFELNRNFLSKIWFGKTTFHPNQALFADMLLEATAEVSGALAFTAAQYVGACRRLALAPNQPLVAHYGGKLAEGLYAIGVGTTHMKPGPCSVNAIADGPNFIINGIIPWVSGYGIFTHILVAARVGKVGMVLAVLPFETVDHSVRVSAPMSLQVMNSTNTVSIELSNVMITADKVLFSIPDDNGAQIRIPPPFYMFPLGCARSALRLARLASKKYEDEEIEETLSLLAAEIESCADHGRNIYRLTDVNEIIQQSITIRAQMDALIMRVINIALPLVGGNANVVGNNLGRLFREACVYSTSLLVAPAVKAKIRAIASKGNGA
jgi:alkylation response protein AidB-like acyl-CoA dehydrogenase